MTLSSSYPFLQTELKIEMPIHKKSQSALKCFHRAVELEKGSRKLWLEYGSLAYQLHSHLSRQKKYKDMFTVNIEVCRVVTVFVGFVNDYWLVLLMIIGIFFL